MEQKAIAFIGAGNMAESIISGLVNSQYAPERIIAAHPRMERIAALQKTYHIQGTTDNQSAVEQAEVVVLTVKPQMMEEVCKPLQSIDFSNKLIISVAAGIACERITQLLSTQSSIVRVMPNTPALVNKGMSGLFANSLVTEPQKRFSENLLKSVGEICWVTKESDINLVISGSGSGPAYFFLFMESLQNELIKLGMDNTVARLLVQQTALGAAEMVKFNPDKEISQLREQVTSKGGTTAAALNVFNEHHLSDIVAKAMQAAIDRAEAMEKLF